MSTKGYNLIKDHRGLTEKQEGFCINYVYYTGLNAKEALGLAGYKYTGVHQSKIIQQLFRNPKVKKRINELIEERNNEILVDKLWEIKKLKTMAESANSDMAQIKAIELLGKTMNIFSETHVYENREDPGKVIREARRKRQEQTDIDNHEKTIPFPQTEDQDEEDTVVENNG